MPAPDRLLPPPGEARLIAAWWGALALALTALLTGGAWSSALPVLAQAASWPLVGVAAAGSLMAWRPERRLRLGLVIALAATAALAVVGSGGLGGPLAPLVLIALAAGLRSGDPHDVAAGTAGAVLAGGAAVAATLSGASASPAPVLQFMALILAAAALGAAGLRRLGQLSDQVEAEQAVRARLERLLADQPFLTVVLNPDGAVHSAYGAPPPGLPSQGLIAGGLVGAVHGPDRSAVMAALVQAAEGTLAEVVFTPREALDRRTALALRRMADGRLAGVLRDVSVQAAREAALSSERDEAVSESTGKTQFLAAMSHELRTPLNAVLGFSDMMRRQMLGDLPPRYLEYAGLIHEAGSHLVELINDVLDVSKIEAQRYRLEPERFDARDPVSDALRLMRGQAHDKGVDLRGVLPLDGLAVRADRRALKQIMLNLLSNAIKFTPARGTVTVMMRAETGMLELVVADTGVGIAREDLPRLGRPFEQAGDGESRARGTGLGLALVRSLAELHGGTLDLESTAGEGTVATVRLPVIVDPAEIIPLSLPQPSLPLERADTAG